MASKARMKRDELPIVTVERPRCPFCGSTAVKTTRSITTEDGSTRTTVCMERKCGKRFLVIVA